MYLHTPRLVVRRPEIDPVGGKFDTRILDRLPSEDALDNTGGPILDIDQPHLYDPTNRRAGEGIRPPTYSMTPD